MSADRLVPIGESSWVDPAHAIGVRRGKDTRSGLPTTTVLLDSGAELHVHGDVQTTVRTLNGDRP